MNSWLTACPGKPSLLHARTQSQPPLLSPWQKKAFVKRIQMLAEGVISPTLAAEEWSSVPNDSDTWGSQNDGPSHLPPWRQNRVPEVPVSSLFPTLVAYGAAAWVSPVPCHILGGPVGYGAQGAAHEWGTCFSGNPNLFLLTVSLRYSLHTTKFSYFKYTINFQKIYRVVLPSTQSNSETFSWAQKVNFCPFAATFYAQHNHCSTFCL